ncbi:MAG: heme o synthase [Candidatus Saccharimonadales bacterium]
MAYRSVVLTVGKYYQLTKPGIIYGNALTAIAGFFFAAQGNINLKLFAFSILGICLVIASACVVNNYIDRGIDAKMTRTKSRALVIGNISEQNALIFAAGLGLCGFTLLFMYTNILTLGLGLVGFVFYIIVYGISKRRSVYGTLIGTISGAIPPLAGYCAVTNQISYQAVILFLILVFWQLPHFYAIAIYRQKEYSTANIPVHPVIKGSSNTHIMILIYIILFAAACISLYVLNYASIYFLVAISLVSIGWIRLAILGITANTIDSARSIFLFSLITIIVFCVSLSLDATFV